MHVHYFHKAVHFFSKIEKSCYIEMHIEFALEHGRSLETWSLERRVVVWSIYVWKVEVLKRFVTFIEWIIGVSEDCMNRWDVIDGNILFPCRHENKKIFFPLIETCCFELQGSALFSRWKCDVVSFHRWKHNLKVFGGSNAGKLFEKNFFKGMCFAPKLEKWKVVFSIDGNMLGARLHQ